MLRIISPTFGDVARAYMDEHKLEVRATTYASYMHLLTRRILPYLDNVKIRKLNPVALQKYVNDQHDRGYKNHSTRDCVSIIKLVLKYAERKKWCKPIADLSVKYPREETSKKDKTLTGDEYARLLKYCVTNPGKRTYPTLLAMTSGLRIGEACAIKYGDINYEGHTLTISRSVKRICVPNQVSSLEVSAPKTEHSARVVPLAPEISALIAAHRLDDDVYISSGNSQFPLEPRSYRQKYKRILAAAGITDHTFHDLRHTFASRCIDNGADARTVADILGHADVEMTLNIYTHSSAERRSAVVAAAAKTQ